MRALHNRAFPVGLPTPASFLSLSRPPAQAVPNGRSAAPVLSRVCPRHAAPAATKVRGTPAKAPPSTAAPVQSLPLSAWFADPAALFYASASALSLPYSFSLLCNVFRLTPSNSAALVLLLPVACSV